MSSFECVMHTGKLRNTMIIKNFLSQKDINHGSRWLKEKSHLVKHCVCTLFASVLNLSRFEASSNFCNSTWGPLKPSAMLVKKPRVAHSRMIHVNEFEVSPGMNRECSEKLKISPLY